jgi:hypothetical protein
MIAALERHRTYFIGLEPDQRELLYIGRYFPEDHPPLFQFQDLSTGEVIEFLLPQLTALEKDGALLFGNKHIG